MNANTTSDQTHPNRDNLTEERGWDQARVVKKAWEAVETAMLYLVLLKLCHWDKGLVDLVRIGDLWVCAVYLWYIMDKALWYHGEAEKAFYANMGVVFFIFLLLSLPIFPDWVEKTLPLIVLFRAISLMCEHLDKVVAIRKKTSSLADMTTSTSPHDEHEEAPLADIDYSLLQDDSSEDETATASPAPEGETQDVESLIVQPYEDNEERKMEQVDSHSREPMLCFGITTAGSVLFLVWLISTLPLGPQSVSLTLSLLVVVSLFFDQQKARRAVPSGPMHDKICKFLAYRHIVVLNLYLFYLIYMCFTDHVVDRGMANYTTADTAVAGGKTCIAIFVVVSLQTTYCLKLFHQM